MNMCVCVCVCVCVRVYIYIYVYMCTQQLKNESAIFSLRESYTYDFLQIIILPMILLFLFLPVILMN